MNKPKCKAIPPNTGRIVLSGYAEITAIIDAFNQGAIYKILIKPWDNDRLRGHLCGVFRYLDAMIKPRLLSQSEKA
jgi:ActR/RegA family two-component response regulator